MKYCLIFLLLLAGASIRAQNPSYYQILITSDKSLTISALETKNDKKPLDPTTASFGKNGGTLLIKNATDKPQTVKLVKAKEGKDDVLASFTLNKNEEKSFAFTKEGTFAESKDLDAAGNGAKLNEVQVLIGNLGSYPLRINTSPVLSPLLSHSEQQNCEACTDIEGYKEGVIYYDFSCKCFYTIGKLALNEAKKLVKQQDGADTLTNEEIKQEAKRIVEQSQVKKSLNLAKMSLRPNQELRFRVMNVNRYIYDVGIESNEVNYDSKVPPLLSQFFIGDSANLLGTLMKNFNKQFVSSPQALLKNADLVSKYETLREAWQEFAALYMHLQALKTTAYTTCTAFPCCNEDHIGFGVEELLTALSALDAALQDLRMEAASQEATQTLKTALAEDRKALDAIKEAERKIDALEEQLKNEKDDQKRAALQKEIDSEDAKTKGKDNLLAAISEKESMLRIFSNIQNLQLKIPTQEEVTRLYIFVHNIRQQHASFAAPPIYATGNRMELIFRFAPRDTVTKYDLMPLYNDSAYYSLPVLWKPFVSFSAGSFLVPQKWLDNITYNWQRIPDENNTVTDTVYRLVQTGYTPRPMGFAAFLNGEWKFARSVGFGPSVGVGLTIEEKPRMAYLGGLSLFFGDQKQVSITGGAIGMQVNTVANNWKAVAADQVKYKTAPTVDYYKEFRTGFFVAVTFTPFNPIKTSLLKGGKKN